MVLYVGGHHDTNLIGFIDLFGHIFRKFRAVDVVYIDIQ